MGRKPMKNKLLSIFIVVIIIIEFTAGNINSVRLSSENNELIEKTYEEKIETNPGKSITNQQNGFTKNMGQLQNDEVLFYTQDGKFWFTEDGAWIKLRG